MTSSYRVKGWIELEGNEKVLRIMDRACCEEAVARAVDSIRKKCFVADAPFLTRLDSYIYSEFCYE